MSEREHRFGGRWTDTKLGVLKRYLKAYNQALKNQPSAAQPFKRAYIDAFAGSGYRSPAGASQAAAPGQGGLDFPDLAEEEPQTLLDGSARMSLQVEPPFDRYLFIDRNPGRCAALEALKEEFPQRASAISVRQGEANAVIRDLCQKNWRSHRAVLFLDPYGMQVEWSTLQAVAKTEAIDLWLLFPLGIGVNRLLPRSGEVPPGWRRRLTLLLGSDDWQEVFYRPVKESDLFGETAQRWEKATIEEIGHHFLKRLRTIFAGVAKEPAVLRNSRGSPLFLLCFAAGNPKGAPIALNIAEYLLRNFADPWPTDPTSNGPKAPGTR